MWRLLRYWVWWFSASSTTEGRSSFAISSSSLPLRQHTSAFVSIFQHSSAYVSIRQHTSAYVRICQRMSAYVSIRQRRTEERSSFGISLVSLWYLFGISALSLHHTSDYVSVRQHTSENVRIREDTSAGRSSFGLYVRIRVRVGAHRLRVGAHLVSPRRSLLRVMSLPLTSRLRPHALVA
jgi:hypothetical protein